jgi:hypothetical protein
MSETLKQVNEAGIVFVVRMSALEVSEVSGLSQDVESLSLEKATVIFRLLERISISDADTCRA